MRRGHGRDSADPAQQGAALYQSPLANTLHTRRPKLLDLTADHADYADIKSIRAISEIRGQYGWAAVGEGCKSKVRVVLHGYFRIIRAIRVIRGKVLNSRAIGMRSP